MGAVIEGTVLGVIDRETIELKIDQVIPPARPRNFHLVETVRVVGGDRITNSEDPTRPRVRCRVERDAAGGLTGSVFVLDEIRVIRRGPDEDYEPTAWIIDP
jgi:hypothetical protein